MRTAAVSAIPAFAKIAASVKRAVSAIADKTENFYRLILTKLKFCSIFNLAILVH